MDNDYISSLKHELEIERRKCKNLTLKNDNLTIQKDSLTLKNDSLTLQNDNLKHQLKIIDNDDLIYQLGKEKNKVISLNLKLEEKEINFKNIKLYYEERINSDNFKHQYKEETDNELKRRNNYSDSKFKISEEEINDELDFLFEVDTEREIIGFILRELYLIREVSAFLKEDHFNLNIYKEIFKACLKVLELELEPENINIYSIFKLIPKNISISIDLLEEIRDCRKYSKTEMYSFRRFIYVLECRYNKIKLKKLYEKSSYLLDKVDLNHSLNVFSEKIISFRTNNSKNTFLPIKCILEGEEEEGLLDEISKMNTDKDYHRKNCISTGFECLDDLIGGLSQTNLIILSSRPAIGKTSLALNIAVNVSNIGHPVCFFTLEMSKKQLVRRILSSESGIDCNKTNSVEYNNIEAQALSQSQKNISDLNLYFCEPELSDFNIIENEIKINASKYNIKVFIIDYLQIIELKSNNSSKYNEVSAISRNLKLLAKNLNICILCLSQLSRKVEQRKNTRPILSDIKDSGCIEQDADQVLLLHKKNYKSKKITSEDKSIIEVIVAKNRHGKTGSVNFCFDSNITKFTPHKLQNDKE